MLLHVSPVWKRRFKFEAERSESTARLMSMPGIGQITAMAIEAFAPSMTVFRQGRSLPAWAWPAYPGSIRVAASRCSDDDLEDGPARHPALADHRRHDSDPLGLPQGAGRTSWLARTLTP